MRACARAPLYIGILVSLCFGRSLYGDFVFDDSEALLQNADVSLDNRLLSLDIFQHDFWGHNLTDSSSHKSYRPLTILVFKCILRASTLFEGASSHPRPRYFHAANLISYFYTCCVLNSTLQLFLASHLIAFSQRRAKQTALLVTLLFTVHPLHTEAVVSCVGLADILSALCCLLAFRIYLRTVDLIFRQPHSVCLPAVQIFMGFYLTVQLSALAMLFKEQGITYLGIFIILNILLLAFHRIKEKRTRLLILVQTCYFVICTAFLLYGRLWVMNFSRPSFSRMDNPASHVPDRLYRYINYSYICLLNVFITICPIFSCFDWSFGTVALIQAPTDIRLFLLTIFLLIGCVILTYLLARVHHHEKRCFLIFAAFAILPFLPASNIFFPVGFVIAERNVFLSILGYLLTFVVSLQRCLQLLKSPYKPFIHGFIYFLLIASLTRSFLRTNDWLHERNLFEKDAQVCPGNAKIYYNIAKVAADSGQVAKAIENYQRSLSLYGNYTSALNNYANILKDQKKLALARRLLEKACTLDPKFAAALMNLAIVEMSLGNYRQSEDYFRRVLQIRPNHANSHFNLGNLYLEAKRYPEAEQAYTRAVQLNSQLVRAWNNLILLNQNKGSVDEALQLAYKALELNPDADSLHFLVANLLGEQGRQVEQSEKHFKRAIALKPQVSKYHYNLAVLYHRNGVHEPAITHYREALRLDPPHIGARKQLKILEKYQT